MVFKRQAECVLQLPRSSSRHARQSGMFVDGVQHGLCFGMSESLVFHLQVAILWEGDSPDMVRSLTYQQLFEDVCRCANALKGLGVRKGDPVCIYMPMIPEAAVAMLACARIGAPHSYFFPNDCFFY